MDRREQVKALEVRPDEYRDVMDFAMGYLSILTPVAREGNHRHYGSSWSLNKELMVLHVNHCGEHYADTLLPLDMLKGYLEDTRKQNAMIRELGAGLAGCRAMELKKLFEGQQA